ncbi:MAG TPA: HAD family hydrolase [Syntrophales bacterium]|nr:HAD family hydrolase [Syntrophales bacterium]
MKKNAAVFFDRDGTLNEEVGYVDSIDKLRLFANTAEAVRLINESGMKAVVITNQSGVARGYFTEEFVRTVHDHIQEILRGKGAFIDAFYYCPHHQTEGIGVYMQSCACRKPEAGMLIEASKELRIDLQRSYTVGDMLKDIQVAHAVGAKGILVKTGYGLNTIQKDLTPDSSEICQPSYIAEDILDAVKWVIEDRKKRRPRKL